MSYYNRIRQGLIQTATSFGGERRVQRAERLANMTYEDALEDRLIYGTPDFVAQRLEEWRDLLGLSGRHHGAKRGRHPYPRSYWIHRPVYSRRR